MSQLATQVQPNLPLFRGSLAYLSANGETRLTAHQPGEAMRDRKAKTSTFDPGALCTEPFKFLEQAMALRLRDT